ncbi:MAG: hypothetical protein AABX51_03745 [Nanoarchaeota archaeon]
MAEQEKSKKTKKKKWFTITTDGLFNNAVLGESLVYAAQDLNGRIISANLMTLTDDIKQQNVNVGLRISEINGDTAVATLISYEMLPSSLKRIVRKEVDRVDASFVVMTKDNIKLRIKPILVTRTSTTQSKAKRLRRMATEFIVDFVGKYSYVEFCRGVIGRGIQSQLRGYLKKVYPLKACDIRSFTITTQGTPLTLGGKLEMPVEERKEEQKQEAPAEA